MDSNGPPEGSYEIGVSSHDAVFSTGSGTSRLRRLEDVLLREVLQRLYLLHPEAPNARAAENPPSDEEIETFANLVIRPDPAAASQFFSSMVERAYDFETLSERFAAPVARRLGEFWEEDHCDFLDVAFGVGRLRSFLAELSGRLEEAPNMRAPRALLISTPGDNHVFAIEILAGILSEAGWTVVKQRGLDLAENTRQVAHEWTHVVGVTMGSLEYYDTVSRTVRGLRRASVNPQMSVIVGGSSFNDDRDLAVRIGADGTAPDGPTTLKLAKRLWLAQTPQVSII